MFELLYPEPQRALFAGRKLVLDRLSQGKHLAILAQKGSGKTLLLKHHITEQLKQRDFAYLDLTKVSVTPERFAVEFMGTICFWMLSKKREEHNAFLDISHLAGLDLGKSKVHVLAVENELQKIKPNQKLLLESAFEFAEEFAKENNAILNVLLDEFQEILSLNNYTQISDVIKLFFEAASAQKHVVYTLISSAVATMDTALAKHIEIIKLPKLEEKEVTELVNKLHPGVDQESIKKIHNYAQGNALVTKALAEKLTETQTADVKTTFIANLVTKDAPLYHHCSTVFNDSLSAARGASLLKAILKVLALEPGLRLSEIARKIYRSSPVTKSLLQRLIDVDIIVKEDRIFDFSDPVIQNWCRFMFANMEFDHTPTARELEEIGGELR